MTFWVVPAAYVLLLRRPADAAHDERFAESHRFQCGDGEGLDGVRGLDEKGLAKPVGPAEGPYADHPYAALVLHIHREVIHHMAEVLLLRDLYGAQH